jgi:UDP-N-acetyl-D-mannosaminuronate dehydrogenase
MYTKDEIEALGFADYEFGTVTDAVVVQANHAEYARIRATDVPGARTVVDGRGVTSPEFRAQVPTFVIGAAT